MGSEREMKCQRCGEPKKRARGRYCAKCGKLAYRESHREEANQAQREYYKTHRDEVLARCKNWRKKLGVPESRKRRRESNARCKETDPVKRKAFWAKYGRERMERFYAKHPLVEKAHNAVKSALKSGKLRRQPCAICGEKGQAHHDDYTEPLAVTWFCKNHHTTWHRLFIAGEGEGLVHLSKVTGAEEYMRDKGE